jgi:hypothetical protein
MADHGFGRRIDRRGFIGAALVTAAGGPALLAQASSQERRVEPLDLPLDKPGVWTLHFRYKAPRIVQVDGFDKNGRPAKQTVWYMWFQVYNRYSEPVTCLPRFELVTKDLNTTHLDEPQPYIFEQIKRMEDTTISKEFPNGALDLKTTIEISKRPIPVSRPDAIPRMVSGLAIWPDMHERAPKTNRFSVYVAGLSSGLATEQAADGQVLIKVKTLQINFLRPTDDNQPMITDIRPDDANGPAEAWIYRAASKVKPTLNKQDLPVRPKPEEKKDEKKKD